MNEANGMSQGQDANVSSPVINSSQTSQSATAPGTSEERTLKQSEVNDLVRRAKSDAVESYKRKAETQPSYETYGEGRPALANPNLSQTMSDDRVRQVAAEEAQRHIENVRKEAYEKSQNESAQRTVQNFYNKVLTAREKYQDFDKVTSDIDLQRFPNVVQLLGDHIENAGDVLYDLGKNRMKMASLEQLAQMSPRDAIAEAKRYSDSIRENEAAGKVRLPNEPLSQLRPSNTGTDNGAMSVGDYRKKYKV